MFNGFVGAIFLTGILLAREGSSQCFTTQSCTGTPIEAVDQRACCVGTETGLSYHNGTKCNLCTVNGFEHMEYTVTESGRIGSMESEGEITIFFRLHVKGSGPSLRFGGIVSVSVAESIAIESSDYEPIGDIPVTGSTAEINLETLNDDIALEYDDQIVLNFTPESSTIISEVESFGQYIRNTTVINIVDNDRLQINFDLREYSVKEGEHPSIVLEYIQIQNSFDILITPVELSTIVGTDLINFVSFGENDSAATVGADFNNASFCFSVPASTTPTDRTFQLPNYIDVVDDDIVEVDQFFALIANIKGVREEDSCFQVAEGAQCFGTVGATRIKISDNDTMVIGFAQRRQNISEGDAKEGEEEFQVNVLVHSKTTSELEYTMEFSVRSPRGGATVVPLNISSISLEYDVRIGTLESVDFTRALAVGGQTEIILPFIRNDFRPEKTECFTIRIASRNVPGSRESFECGIEDFFCLHTICIEDDDDPFTVGFVKTTYTVDESVNFVEVCVNLIKPARDILDETVFVVVIEDSSSADNMCDGTLATADMPALDGSYMMQDGTDFEQQTSDFNKIKTTVINQTMRTICYEQPIYNDECLEGTEYFGLTLGVSLASSLTIVEPMYDLSTICIVDDDSAVVGLEMTFYNVSEDVGVVEVCAIVYSPTGMGCLNCPINFTFSVNLSTGDMTAEAPMDYGRLVDHLLNFNACQRRSCVDIPIVDDEVLEDLTESFNLTLERPSGLDSRITLSPVDGTVNIIDNDDAVVGLVPTFYQVTEGVVDVVELCAVVRRPDIACPIDLFFDVEFSTIDDTAVSSMDYGLRDLSCPFAACERQSCVNVTINDDSVVEFAEIFFASLERNGLNSRISLDPTRATIEILDNDRAVVGLEQTFYSVSEGVPVVRVCAVVYMPDDTVSCPISFPFSVALSTGDMTARAPMDYGRLVDHLLDFTECQRKSCVDIPIVDDMVLELVETFSLTLERPSGLDSRITLSPVDGTVDIHDNDVARIGLESTFYSATEGVDPFVRVCTIVYRPTGSCHIPFEFTVDFLTSDITAVVDADYVDSDRTHMFAACETRKCVDVPIVDDNVYEMVETLNISLGTPSDNRISVSPPEGIILITDNDPIRNVSLVNDTVTGDPLMTVPIFTTPNNSTLCYEVHGEANKYFNLISDNCVAVTAHYVPAAINNPNITLNVINAVGVRAVSSNRTCVNIEVGLQGCSARVNGVPVTMYRVNGIVVRRYSNRVRITVPNCGETDLVMWIFCTSGSTEDPFTWQYFSFDFLRFVVMRGLNLNESSHGLLGQFWNVPVEVKELTADFNGVARTDDYNITVRYPGSPARSFVGLRTSVTWEFEKKPCLYVGNSQAGPLGEEVDPNDSVIEGTYRDYMVVTLFSPRFKFAHVDENNCMTK